MRNFLIASALFLLAATSAFAAVVTEENGSYWLQPDGDNTLTVNLTKPGGANWHYGLYSLDTGNTWEMELATGDNTVDLTGQNVTKIGVWAYQSNGGGSAEKKDAYSYGATSNHAQFHFAATGTVIAFTKNGTDKGRIDFGGNDETVGSPLPAPVVTLLIALACGAGFVMYRNRKQVKA